jgi:hypothetical protein
MYDTALTTPLWSAKACTNSEGIWMDITGNISLVLNDPESMVVMYESELFITFVTTTEMAYIMYKYGDT